MQIAACSPYWTRSGGDWSSGLWLMSGTAVARPLSITAPMIPWPFCTTRSSTAEGSPSDMIAAWLPSAVVRVSSPALAMVTRTAVSRVFCSRTLEPCVTVVSACETSPSASSAVSNFDAWPVTTWRMREFSTATPAIVPSSSRAATSRWLNPADPFRPRQMAPSTPSLPRIGVRASLVVPPSVLGTRPLKRPSSAVIRLRRTVSPSRTLASGPTTGSGGSEAPRMTYVPSGWNRATLPAS